MNYYEILDVPRNAVRDQIRAAYRIQVQLFHPDRLVQASAALRVYGEERLKLINEAYTILNDPARRAKYDAALRARERMDGAAPPPSAATRKPSAPAGGGAQPRKAATPPPLTLTLTPGVTLALVRVPAGEFLMGSDPVKDLEARDDEVPQHRVYLPEFYISQTPVTNAQYAVFVRAANYAPPKRWKNNIVPAGKDAHPVVAVSWEDANAFAQWLARLTRHTCRLPTEAEWEKAARGSDGRLYPWGNVWEARKLNSYETGPDHTTAVGQYSPHGDSPYGAMDMSGNVQEWCLDWYDSAEYRRRARITHQPRGPRAGITRVIRGGSFEYYGEAARCACRNDAHPGRHVYSIGFRLVVIPPLRRG
jgi:iron(II)-dependent oxidoreductase